jgi:hypothetical protein
MSLAPNGGFARLRTGGPVDRALCAKRSSSRASHTVERLQHVRPTMEALAAGDLYVLSRERLTVND